MEALGDCRICFSARLNDAAPGRFHFKKIQ
jgi:hypothetical protein